MELKLLNFKSDFLYVYKTIKTRCFLFRKALSFSAYTTADASLRHSLHIGLLPSAIGCALKITS